MMEIRNAIIESAALKIEEHGILSAMIMLDYEDSGHQGFGGWCLYNKLEGPNVAGHLVVRTLKIAGVNDWAELPGKTIRARIEGGFIRAIGNIVKDDWFFPDDDFAKVRSKACAQAVAKLKYPCALVATILLG